MSGAGYDWHDPVLTTYHAAIDRSVERLIAKQPRFGIVRAIDPTTHESVVASVWDHKTDTFHPIAELLAPLFAAVGLEAA